MGENIYMDRISKLRIIMATRDIDAYIILTDDFHASEYVDDYFKCREFMSGFTGSAGTLVVTDSEALLWTDGRYFLQAQEELRGSGIILMKAGEKGVKKIPEYLLDKLSDGQCIGYDGRTINGTFAAELKDMLGDKHITYVENVDLVGELWKTRPEFPTHPIYELPLKYAGVSRQEKISDVRNAMEKEHADYHLLSSLDDICWLFNIRGNDIAYSPVAMCYALIERTSATLYIAVEAVPEELVLGLSKAGVRIKAYLEIYTDLTNLPYGVTLMADPKTVNVALMAALPEYVRVLERTNPTALLKACKNSVEMENERIAHIKDGVAVTKLIYWLKTEQKKESFYDEHMTELYISDKLLEIRKQNEDFVEQSFAPIIAAGQHGAIVHYEPTKNTDMPVVRDSFLLMDTGAHYLQGTTDITRTVAVGNISDEAKKHYTAVLRGNLNLASAVFKYGCSGPNLDILARTPLWEQGLDYNHGTGHGVGYMLNVHEGPQGIRMKELHGRVPFEEGMLTSDEPGLYLEGRYGIRLENLMLCRKGDLTDYGQYMYFETLTMVPFDRAAIDKSLMSERELKLLNEYHIRVYDTISPYLTEDERNWLYEETREIR